MPAYARKEIVREDEVAMYHCVSRCVRRAFLCGQDPISGKDFEHRKDWIRAKLEELAGIFAVDVCGYAVLANHVHVVVRTRPDIVARWSDDEVAGVVEGRSRPAGQALVRRSGPLSPGVHMNHLTIF